MKTLTFSFDGTGNEPGDAGRFDADESISNVLKLHILLGGGVEPGAAISTQAGTEQRSFYYNGIGTREEGRAIPLLGSVVTAINMALAPRWGDAARILYEAREDFRQAYERGDRVVVFGYSRGAALARKFVGQILGGGDCEDVAFLGVFDTVAAMDGIHRPGETIATDVVFENGTLHEDVQRAVHLVSLDENRVAFTPTLINHDPKRPDRIRELWFPGVHGDVGGGYWLDGLSDLALVFMRSECRAALGQQILLHPPDDRTVRWLLDAKGDSLAGIEVDDIVTRPMPDAILHSHGGLRSPGGVMATMGAVAPRQVCVHLDDRPSAVHLPVLHHSIAQRFHVLTDYRPPSLRGRRFRLRRADGTDTGALHGIVGLRSADIGPA